MSTLDDFQKGSPNLFDNMFGNATDTRFKLRDALQDLEMADSDGSLVFQDPYHWAPFVLIGDGAQVL